MVSKPIEARFLHPNEVDCPKCKVLAGTTCVKKSPGAHADRIYKARFDSSCLSAWTITVGGPYEGQEHSYSCELPLGHSAPHRCTSTWTDAEADGSPCTQDSKP